MSTPPPPDRIQQLHQTDAFVGLDFVYVFPSQTRLAVFFHPAFSKSAEDILTSPVLQSKDIEIFSPSGGERLPVVPLAAVKPLAWKTVDQRRVLIITTAEPGDFSRYRLRIKHPQVDLFFQEVGFSFKANCPSLLDCEPPAHECAPEPMVDYPVNYQARDFWSFRQALLDYAADRHPAWQDRLEADLGVMLLELMSSQADEFAYLQDRTARESRLDTAAQRRSLRRHARLVDYQVRDGLGATTWLDFTVSADTSVRAGTPIWESVLRGNAADPSARRAASRAIFEVGHGLASGHARFLPTADTFPLWQKATAMKPYQRDRSQTCLPAGATTLEVQEQLAAVLSPDAQLASGEAVKWVFLKTTPIDPGVPSRAWLVPLTRSADDTDLLMARAITRLEWPPAYATPFEMEYATLGVRGNIVPATAGETLREQFQIEPTSPPGVAPFLYAVERPGPFLNVAPGSPADDPTVNQPRLNPTRLFTLPGSEERDLVWRGASPATARPEIRLARQLPPPAIAEPWIWQPSLLGVHSSQPDDADFTLDDGAWRRVAGYRRVDETGAVREFVHQDYANNRGVTIRFGNGEFGRTPGPGDQFEVIYRLGNDRADNVAAGSLTDFEATSLPLVTSVTNPFDVTDAVAPQPAAEVRQVAPEAFRAETFRAVRAEDYAEAVERLPWVQRAGARFRWTGSWLSLFATPDPRGSFEVTTAQRRELGAQLDRFRMTGREAWGRDPEFATVDLEIHVCVAPFAYAGEVLPVVAEALFGRGGLRPLPGFFSPDHFTFGQPLDRGQLEAAIQAVEGVRAVETIRIRRRGWFDWRDFTEAALAVGDREIVRVENNPNFPERGIARLIPHGGA